MKIFLSNLNAWGNERKNSKTIIHLVYFNVKHQKQEITVFYFFIKKHLKRVVWTVLTFFFSFYSLLYRVSIFCLPWQIVIQLLDQLPRFYLLNSQCHEISLKYFSEGFFTGKLLLVSLLLRHLQSLFSFMLISPPLLSFFGYRSRIFQMVAMSTFPWLAISPLTPFMLDPNFTSCAIAFHFCAVLSSVLSNSLFQ